MSLLLDTLLKDEDVKNIVRCIENKSNAQVYGLDDSSKIAIFAAAAERKPMIIVTADQNTQDAWRDDLQSIIPDASVFTLPELDFFNVNAAAKSLNLYAQRVNILNRLMQRERIIVLATASAVVNPIPRPDILKASQLNISVGSNADRDDIINQLNNLGYQRCVEIEHIGQFAVRGGIFDIFPINSESPLRLEFFDDTVNSIRVFDIDSKRSLKNIDSIIILPLALVSDLSDAASIISYLNDGLAVFDEPDRIIENIKRLIIENKKANILSFEHLICNDNAALFFVSLLPKKIDNVKVSDIIHFSANAIASFQGHLELMVPALHRWINSDCRILFLLDNNVKIHRISDFLRHNNIHSPNITFIEGSIHHGFFLSSSNLVVISDNEIFGQPHKKQVTSTKKKSNLDFFKDINAGDYIVHSKHGIGKFMGVISMDIGGCVRDYLKIQYYGEDKLFLPTDQLHFIHKYVSVGDSIPKLSRLNTSDWSRAKSKASAAAEDIAHKLIDIYARRHQSSGFAFASDDALQAEFEDACDFELTADQARTLSEVKADMEADRPMDRLICGDVGFGKTEIAIRAAFKAAMNGKQVAVLVPTTVLAQQHYQTFTKRFNGFLPTVGLLSRFRSPAQQNETLKQIKDGTLDILIGTHAVLNSNRVHFKNLGLFIIDEEQRFGVKQKDKFRDLSSGVDVLSLSATPIPRSLHMSLVGARDLSVIETAPLDRFPVQTYVIESDDFVISEAITRELNRGGQIFFVYNRIDTIDTMKEHLQELVPEARIKTAHAQMSNEYLERIMMEFYEGEFDILLTTTIIENGLDVANANTLIVYNADHFGLSQLYQLRGRVGRSNRLAFAYFMFNPDKVLSSVADKRLQAIKDFAQLGASFNIALRDLQIRGAGNLLGSQQHGHIAGVGFALYSRLLENAINNLRRQGGQIKTKIDDLDNNIEEAAPNLSFHIDAFFDDEFIPSSTLKLQFYQKLANFTSVADVFKFSEELEDRFGKLPNSAQNLIHLTIIKLYAKALHIVSIIEKDDFITIQLPTYFVAKPELLSVLTARLKNNLIILSRQNMMKLKITPKVKKKLLPIIMLILKTLLIKK